MATKFTNAPGIYLQVDPESTRKIVNNIRKYQSEKLDKVSALIRDTARGIFSQARTDIPVRTGYAKSTTYLSPTKDKDGRWIGAEVGTFAYYAVYIEARTGYLSSAYNAYITGFVNELKSIMKS